MFYDLMIDSPGFLNLVQGEDDPYTWTTGQGCGYSLRGERDEYKNQTEENVLLRASRELYYIDEGETVGVVDRNLLLGGVTPRVGDYSFQDPLQEVGVLQTLYVALLPDKIVERVQNCNRPGGSVDITVEDAEFILRNYKEAFENAWSEGWNKKDDGEVQFVIFTDDNGVIGTTGRMLRDITLDNGKLMAISIILIAFFSVMILISPDWIESRVLITLIGVGLVLLAFFASIGLAILVGIKINVTIAWTLPFIILGLGVDDVYIVLMALKKQKGYREQNFIKAMKEVAVPVTMTSLVNCAMFAVMNISDVSCCCGCACFVILNLLLTRYLLTSPFLSSMLDSPYIPDSCHLQNRNSRSDCSDCSVSLCYCVLPRLLLPGHEEAGCRPL
jgi:hypothetical protein